TPRPPFIEPVATTSPFVATVTCSARSYSPTPRENCQAPTEVLRLKTAANPAARADGRRQTIGSPLLQVAGRLGARYALGQPLFPAARRCWSTAAASAAGPAA